MTGISRTYPEASPIAGSFCYSGIAVNNPLASASTGRTPASGARSPPHPEPLISAATCRAYARGSTDARPRCNSQGCSL
jgi:hypothetical protein